MELNAKKDYANTNSILRGFICLFLVSLQVSWAAVFEGILAKLQGLAISSVSDKLTISYGQEGISIYYIIIQFGYIAELGLQSTVHCQRQNNNPHMTLRIMSAIKDKDCSHWPDLLVQFLNSKTFILVEFMSEPCFY